MPQEQKKSKEGLLALYGLFRQFAQLWASKKKKSGIKRSLSADKMLS